VIRVDVGIGWRSFDKYKFGHGLPSRLHRIRGRISISQSDAACSEPDAASSQWVAMIQQSQINIEQIRG
jgi:hypothetical protein